MLYGEIERELLDGEPWFLSQQIRLPNHLQRLVEQEQGRRDIWEWQSTNFIAEFTAGAVNQSFLDWLNAEVPNQLLHSS